MDASKVFALTNVVVRSDDPFMRTLELAKKLLPVTVRENPDTPNMTERGLIVVMLGVGFTMEPCCLAELPPPGAALKTTKEGVPVLVRRVEGMMATRLVAVMKVVFKS